MIIKSLSYTNYKGMGTGRIQLSPNLTVFVGKNGSGKSSLLQAITIVLSWIIARIKSEKGSGMYIDELSVTNGTQNAQIIAEFDEIGRITIPNKAKSGANKLFSIDLEDLRAYTTTLRENISKTDYSTSIPIFAFYGVKRAVVDIPLRIRNTDEFMFEAYKDCLNGAANFRDFFMWFRNQEDLENERLLESQSLFSVSTEPTHSRELDTFRRALKIFMPEYKNVRIKRKPLRMIVSKDSKELNVAQLSDGEKIYLALIGDLCRKLVLANPSLSDPLKGQGIVMIDEVDLHLHPQWQSEIISSLTAVFPNLQFILTTHSPQVINRIPTESLRVLDNGVIESPDYGYGMPTSIVLKDIMGIKSELPEKVESLITAIYKSLEKGVTQKTKDYVLQLEDIVPEHPELKRIRKIVERMDRK